MNNNNNANLVWLNKLNKKIRLAKSSKLKRLLISPYKTINARILEIRAEKNNDIAEVNTNTFFDEEMLVVIPEVVSSFIYRYGFFEEGLCKFLLENIKPGMTYFDVGAHYGFFSMLASKFTGDKGTVHSFEPTKSTFQILEKNSKNKKNIKINQLALWSEKTSVEFNDFGVRYSAFNSAFNSRMNEKMKSRLSKVEKYSVETISIDAYAEENNAYPDIMKIDAETAEYQILLGMEKTFTIKKPYISMEIGDLDVEGAVSCKEVILFLVNKGYNVFEFKSGKFSPHIVKEKYGTDNLFFIPRVK